MTIYYNAENRKELVNAISAITGVKAVYMKTPTYAYKIDYFTVTREGNLVFDDMADSEEIENLIEALAEKGFIAEASENDSQTPEIEDEGIGLCISIPRTNIAQSTIENLKALLEAKGELIKRALGVSDLPITVTDENISFPWFDGGREIEEINAVTVFIGKLYEMAASQKRINKNEKPIDNEKYAFRCFLLRLGFIGDEYKAVRKELLKNLNGSSAFKNGTAKKESGVCENA